MFEVMQYKLEAVPGYPNGAFFHAIYDRASKASVHTLKGEFGRSKSVIRAAENNPGEHVSTDRSLENGLHYWMRRHIITKWTETSVGLYSSKEEANAAAALEDKDLMSAGLKSIRRRPYVGEANPDGPNRPANWGNPFQATKAKLYDTVVKILEPLDLSAADLDKVQRQSYDEYNRNPNVSKIITRGDLYIYVCDKLNLQYY